VTSVVTEKAVRQGRQRREFLFSDRHPDVGFSQHRRRHRPGQSSRSCR